MGSLQPFLDWLREHLFAVVLVSSFVDATGLPFPGRVILVVAGIAATDTHDVVLLIMISMLGSLLGDHLLYAAGMRGGFDSWRCIAGCRSAPRVASRRPCAISGASARRPCW